MRFRIVDRWSLPSPSPSLRLVAEGETLEALRAAVDRLIRERDARATLAELLASVGNSEFARVVGEACEVCVWEEWYGEIGGEG